MTWPEAFTMSVALIVVGWVSVTMLNTLKRVK
jgi:hypothetical protein